MMEKNSFVGELEDFLEEGNYPKEFLEDYDQIECLASHNGRETFLVQRKADSKNAVATCYDCSTYPFSADIGLLCELDHPRLPKYYGKYENGQMICVVREYIEGVTLSAYAAEGQLTMHEIVDKSKQLCDILEVLHTHNPQIVHRDIKPENIIVKPDGKIVLIDFDIARTVKEDAGTDTVFFGTKVYAPPEQYGFGQTDSRADIYAFGVLLRWMVTGSAKKNNNISLNPKIEDIIERCTAFTPDQRYKDIAEVRRALDNVISGKKKSGIKPVYIYAAAAVLLLVAGLILGKVIFGKAPDNDITFKDPVIEKAVRAWIGKEEGELTGDDISKVTRLYIYGTRVFNDPDQYYKCTVDTNIEGTLHSLEDIAMLKNLEELHIVHQGYVDASGIAGLTKLYTVELKHMRLGNVSAVAGAPNLKEAVLFCDGLSDLTVLQDCPWLESLDIGLNDIKNLDQIGYHPNVKNLGLMWLNMDNLDGIAEHFPKLENVMLQYSEIEDMSGLKELKKLETVKVLKSQADAVKALLADTGVKVDIIED